jgi:MoaA/NifB/PqqE/SkfB family radical SAM enzyme
MGFMNQPNEPAIDLGAGESYPLFNRVSLETTSKCNRRCSFCPVSTGRRDFPMKHMDWELYSSICEQLGELEFEGVAQMFLIDEPTLNKDLEAYVRLLRGRCPNVTTYVSTNGDVIVQRPEVFEQLWSMGVSSLNLNVYDNGQARLDRLAAYEKIISNFKEVYGDYRLDVNPDKGKYTKGTSSQTMRVYVTDMSPERLEEDAAAVDTFYDREASKRTRTRFPDNKCPKPHRHLVVRYDGSVILCCGLDPSAPGEDNVVGDLNTQSVLEVWNSDEMNRHRFLIQENGRRHSPCDTCDMRTSFPGIFRYVKPSAQQLTEWTAGD